MEIFNVIWLDSRAELTVESFSTFEKAFTSVKSELKHYTRRYELNALDYEANNIDDYYFARIEDIVEVQIVKTEVQ